ncbi:hypothetical protein SKAU_G00317080 [Synaphobranchus kaupii]|uniref:Uncharacterized protein n=1 Tax=Synaphobranchus kaupii TaxID=118154 RepID=A0A9Q1IJQ4_SYNKA|nr:hypothetical protein SKAU_G00317080 [Synaphobranchus kaupii]
MRVMSRASRPSLITQLLPPLRDPACLCHQGQRRAGSRGAVRVQVKSRPCSEGPSGGSGVSDTPLSHSSPAGGTLANCAGRSVGSNCDVKERVTQPCLWSYGLRGRRTVGRDDSEITLCEITSARARLVKGKTAAAGRGQRRRGGEPAVRAHASQSRASPPQGTGFGAVKFTSGKCKANG